MMYSLLVFASIFMPVEEVLVTDGAIRVHVVRDDPTWSRHSHTGLREVQVVRDTMVFVTCVDPPDTPVRKAVRDFVRCMHGPPYLCGPTVRADGSRSPTYQDWWRYLPPAKKRPYVCIGDLSRAGCVLLDRDCDGDVDLADWPILLAELARPPRAPERGYCGQDPNTIADPPNVTPWGDLRP